MLLRQLDGDIKHVLERRADDPAFSGTIPANELPNQLVCDRPQAV
jgi:hypothetical protein